MRFGVEVARGAGVVEVVRTDKNAMFPGRAHVRAPPATVAEYPLAPVASFAVPGR